ncbi:hypothetical protein LSUB1_G003033 [Lachnellula subtilissima]|uniref:EthD domain-containing protein n=1 Tax=Lachnellula subtilissima TaxID=602034 RepID=A0A8H8RTN6_9HELO|nr:hypothetical protein LSUB1_G003033 [Lachnellula subtilissima]
MSGTTPTKQVKLTILVKKLDTLSTEEFHRYWRAEHPKAWLSVAIVKANVLKYSQFHVNNPVTEDLRTKGLPMAGYDGGVNIHAGSVEELVAVFQDEEYLRVVVPDEEKFLKRSEGIMMLGWEDVVWVDGKEIPASSNA